MSRDSFLPSSSSSDSHSRPIRAQPIEIPTRPLSRDKDYRIPYEQSMASGRLSLEEPKVTSYNRCSPPEVGSAFPKRESRFNRYAYDPSSSPKMKRLFEESFHQTRLKSEPEMHQWDSQPDWPPHPGERDGPSSARPQWDSSNSRNPRQHFPNPQDNLRGSFSGQPNREAPNTWTGRQNVKRGANGSNSNSYQLHRNSRGTGRGNSYRPNGLSPSSSSDFPDLPESTTRPAPQWSSRRGNSRRANRPHLPTSAPATRFDNPKRTHPTDPPEEPTPPASSQSSTGEFVSPLNNLYSGTANSCQTGRGYGVQRYRIPKKTTSACHSRRVTKPHWETDPSTATPANENGLETTSAIGEFFPMDALSSSDDETDEPSSSLPEKKRSPMPSARNSTDATVTSTSEDFNLAISEDETDVTDEGSKEVTCSHRQNVTKKKGTIGLPREVVELQENVVDFMKGTLGSRRCRSRSSQPDDDNVVPIKRKMSGRALAPEGGGNETTDDFEIVYSTEEPSTDAAEPPKREGLIGRQLYLCGNIGCDETFDTAYDFEVNILYTLSIQNDLIDFS